MVFRVRERLIRQRTRLINALRGHRTEFGIIAPNGAMNVKRLVAVVQDDASVLPQAARQVLEDLIGTMSDLEARIGKLDAEIRTRAQNNEMARRLMTVPGIGPLIATALVTLAPPAETFRRGRDFAAWLGLAGLGAATAFYGRQTALGRHNKDGRTLPATIADRRGQQRHHQTACSCRGAPGHLAGRHAGTQARDAGASGTGEQDGAHRLGFDGQGRRLPVSGRGGESRPSVARTSERKRARSSLAQ